MHSRLMNFGRWHLPRPPAMARHVTPQARCRNVLAHVAPLVLTGAQIFGSERSLGHVRGKHGRRPGRARPSSRGFIATPSMLTFERLRASLANAVRVHEIIDWQGRLLGVESLSLLYSTND